MQCHQEGVRESGGKPEIQEYASGGDSILHIQDREDEITSTLRDDPPHPSELPLPIREYCLLQQQRKQALKESCELSEFSSVQTLPQVQDQVCNILNAYNHILSMGSS